MRLRSTTLPGRSADDLADDRRVRVRVDGPAWRRARASARAASDDRQALPLVGDVERIEAEDLARPPHGLARPGFGSPRDGSRRRPPSRSRHSALATPPRVGSRRTWTDRAGRVEERSRRAREAAPSRSRAPSRTRAPRGRDMIATPWTAIAPLRRTTSPGSARRGEISIPARTSPMPETLTKMPSPLPRSTTFVSPGDDRDARREPRRPASTARPARGPPSGALPRG